MTSYLSAMAAIALVLAGWVAVQQIARVFAAKHPELGPYSENPAGCGGRCGCAGASKCEKSETL